MTMKLHRCKGLFIKGPHPCWVAQKALDESGVEYEMVKHPILRGGRSEMEQLTGQKKLPVIEFEDGSFLHDSKVIADRARQGTLRPGA